MQASDKHAVVATDATSPRRRWALRLPKTLWPKFRTKDLLWLILFAAVLMCWYRDRLTLQNEIVQLKSGRSNNSSWSIKQLLGKPNTLRPGDQSTAWASQTQDAANEWVIVEFPRAVNVKQLVVYETYNPGAVSKICSVDFRGSETQIWKGTDPTPTTAGMGRSTFKPKSNCTSRRFKIYLDSRGVAGWNEIDAVALHSTDSNKSRQVQWASNGWASSSYGENQVAPTWFWP